MTTIESAAQWQLMDDFYATAFAGEHCIARNTGRIVAVHVNHMVYESDPDNIYWRELAILPTEVPNGAGISGIFLSPNNEIYVLTKTDLYKLLESTMEWHCLTRTLENPTARIHSSLAVDNHGVLIIASGGSIGGMYRSTNAGASWEYVGTYSLLNQNSPVQFSAEGTLFLNTRDGLLRSYDHGATAEYVAGDFLGPRFVPFWGSNNSVIVVNDTTIYGSTDMGSVYAYMHRTGEWDLLRDPNYLLENFPRMGLGDDGTLFYMYLYHSTDEKAIEWSTDNGTTWRRRDLTMGELGRNFVKPDILMGDSRRVVTYESSLFTSEMFEFLLNEMVVYHRARPIARSHTSYITGNNMELLIYGWNHEYYYNKHTANIFLKGSTPFVHNRILVDGGSYYQLQGRWNRESDGRLKGANVAKYEGPELPYLILPCGFVQFVISKDKNLIGVLPKGPVLRYDSMCTSASALIVSELQADMIAVNQYEQTLIALERGGEFECRSVEGTLISKGRLAPFVDSIGWVQNDTRGNFVFLGKNTAYCSNDYGATWALSSVPSNGASMSKVIVDQKDCFYLLDYSNGLYWSHDGGRIFETLPLSFDSLACNVTDIYSDGEYLYCTTSGCGVYRMALPSLSGLGSLRSIARAHAPINIYVGGKQYVSIDVPFDLDGSTMLRMSDLNGRILYNSEYTVDISRSMITLDTKTISNGVYMFMIASLKEAICGKLMIER